MIFVSCEDNTRQIIFDPHMKERRLVENVCVTETSADKSYDILPLCWLLLRK